MYNCSDVFMLLKMTGTIGISHYHPYIVLCKRGGLVGSYIDTDKPYTTSINILFYLNNWRTRLFTDNSIADSDFIKVFFFLRFLLVLAFWGLLAHSLGSLDTWGWIVQYLQTTQWWKSPRAEQYNTIHE